MIGIQIAAGAALAGLLALGLGGPAAAQDKKVRVQVASTYPGSMVQLGTLGIGLTKKITEASGGSIEMRFFEPGALVPALQVFDSVSTGAIDAGWSTPGYWTGKEIALAMFSSVPFGPGAGEYMGWIFYGGGKELQQEIYSRYNIHSIPCGVIAPEASGWFRKEIKTLADLKGLKMRFFGLGAKVMEKLGVSTQLLAGGEIFQALQLGTIDATEFSMPAIDLALGFHQVAKHYYFPGWHQQSTFFDLMLSQKKWAELSAAQKRIIDLACGDNYRESLAEGESIQVKALAELKEKGVNFHVWSPEILAAMEKAWNEVVAEESAKSPDFRRVWASYAKFRADYKIWKELGYLK
ncbi:MAG: TRAP transporter substrate-binding protein [Pseudomonadota bacterium]